MQDELLKVTTELQTVSVIFLHKSSQHACLWLCGIKLDQTEYPSPVKGKATSFFHQFVDAAQIAYAYCLCCACSIWVCEYLTLVQIHIIECICIYLVFSYI